MKRLLLQLVITLLLVSTSSAYYQSAQGRWLNRDRITESGGLNVYACSYNSTINLIDRYGLSTAYEGNASGWSGSTPQSIEDAREKLKAAIKRLRELKHNKPNDCKSCFKVTVESYGTNYDGNRTSEHNDAERSKMLRGGDPHFMQYDDWGNEYTGRYDYITGADYSVANDALRNSDYTYIAAHSSEDRTSRVFVDGHRNRTDVPDAQLEMIAVQNGNQCNIYGCYSETNPGESINLDEMIMQIVSDLDAKKCNADNSTTETITLIFPWMTDEG